jgi:putative oxidoreductase|tara:strand:- start:3811 stop:4191 length:381 start_codon:yes stop_codon:yes gene_type:complete
MHVFEVLGRVLLSSLFIIEGVNKFFNQEETIMYMEDYGVSEIFFFPTVILEVFIPILLIVGYKTRILGSIMCLFTLTVALIFHLDFDSQIQLIMLLKDLAIAGGFLLIASREPGLCSIDYFLKNKH